MRDAVLLGDDRDRVRVPLGDTVAALDLRALVDEQPRTVGHTMPRLLTARLVEQHHLAVAAHGDRQPRRVDDDVAVLDLDRRVECSLDRGLLCATPPMWKVRIVSCVPGSPMDCAAMTPTASPIFTTVPRARSRP